MFMTIPTWLITLRTPDGKAAETYRVPESNLDGFLHVLTFNRMEFNVRREKEQDNG